MLFLIAQDYFLWHYTRAFREFFHVWMNLIWFTIHFFSLPQLLRTWISPYKRITEERQQGFSFEDWLGTVLVNILSRIVGAILRTTIIIAGTASLLFVIAFGATIYVLWILLPILTLTLFIAGISFILI